MPAVAFTKSKRAQSTTDNESWVPGEVSPTMSCFDQGDTRATTVVAFQSSLGSRGGDVYEDGSATTVRVGSGIGIPSPPAVATAMAVRRLTPRECERLQGFPDDYTLVEYRKKPAADGPRYRALGNSMAVPVMRWIGERIKMVDELRSSP
jgi:DNA (cytosine-5)-methyltransferase 1